MLKSMTGFGRGEVQKQHRCFNIEIKTVNHRYLDVSIKMPKRFTYLEEKIRQLLKEKVKRGRIDAYISYENIGESDVKVVVDQHLANEYVTALQSLEKMLGIENDITVSNVASFSDVISLDKVEEDEAEIWQCLKESIILAMKQLTIMRVEEGRKLNEDLVKRLKLVESFNQAVEERSPQVVQEYKQRLTERIKELLEEEFTLDDQRIATEVALFADKSNITEEVVRLNSHIHQFRQALEEEESIGRKLDFIIQEMNREINTIGSKANDLIITNIVVNLKSELEKMREQVQNIE
ncbi:domain of unknown function DUF1732 [Alkaliphilus metalliredigens QYMF]|uniref:YicC N-terminal domain protein n=2 Tax=Alkaliphilus TaxID=114627 RepID=A6TRX4_ALKMQ|nr:domain of unknown function DUF1732 [Alkaliphilus metalliredigens QYMF]